ncbi:MAG: SufS family cysteine desulfurase [Atopobiaceae bacterium]|jgi:cysteine desulfurase/selenocysteine lyase|nr:SufS family cysteine desulfurase [Atopobiaceae bacterium]MCI2172711.1 SufS family cysteine desulfurase [Atopobiaceae bacterium]MCI2207018.1 SufS family cysteine desulfurase [Atopobiaceae bacterium]
MSIDCNPYKADFPLLVGNPGLAYLDSAATAQRPTCVLDAQRRFYETMNANPLRGLYSLSVAATDAIADARAHVARFIGAPSADEVVFCRNASEALNIAARCLGDTLLSEGDEVAITVMEHHSNLIPWQQACRRAGAKLVYLRPDEHGHITSAEIAEKVGPRTKVVSCCHVSNVLGSVQPIRELARAAHANGATFVVDAAQSAPHMAIDVSELGCDLLALSAHKLMGPMGVGVLWGRRDLLDSLPPFLTGGEMIDSVTETDATWAPVPEKFEAGTQDAAGIYAFGAALDYLEGVGLDAVEARERELVDLLMDGLATLPFVDIVGSPDASDHVGVVSFNVEGIHPHDVASILDADHVAIRAGHHCAQPLLTWMGIQSCCRASVAFYNDANDVDALIRGLAHVWEVFHGND